jgi:hypothetical protein
MGGGLRVLIAARAPLPQKSVLANIIALDKRLSDQYHILCGSPALGAMGGGLRDLIAARAPLPQKSVLANIIGLDHKARR